MQVDPAKLAAMGLTLEDVRQVLSTATADAPKARSTPPSDPIRSDNDQLTHANEYKDVIVG